MARHEKIDLDKVRRPLGPCVYLTGENIRPIVQQQARAMAGMRVEYLQERDIDKSGRGYFFPRIGVIVASYHRQIEFSGGEVIPITSIREMIAKPLT